MENLSSTDVQRWIKKCLKKEFGSAIEKHIAEDPDSISETAQELIQSKEMAVLLNVMKAAVKEQCTSSTSYNIPNIESRPQSSLSYASTYFATDDWSSPKGSTDPYAAIIEKINCEKPVHVRLAGYETLLKSDLSNINMSPSWDLLQKTLTDGLSDDSRPVFEASLKVHSKLLNSSLSCVAYGNLLGAFNAQYHSQKSYGILPTLTSGINFKLFLHEKLFRIMRLIVNYQTEMLKSVRGTDKMMEEIIERFVTFLSTNTFGKSMQPNTLSVLNIVSVLEPRAVWSKNWIHSVATRRVFVSALGKSPSLLQNIIQCVSDSISEPPTTSLSIAISDEPSEVCITGDTVKTITYLHCLSFLLQLCNCEAGCTLLSAVPLDTPFSITDFVLSLLNSLNSMSSSEVPTVFYEVSCALLQSILDNPTGLCESEHYKVTLSHLNTQPAENDIKIWPHMLYMMIHMLDTTEGIEFMISDNENSDQSNVESLEVIRPPNCPAVAVVRHTSNVLRRPFSIINVEYVSDLFDLAEKTICTYEVYNAIEVVMHNQLYPALSYFYMKLDKYFVENEKKAQYMDSRVKRFLLKIVSVPLVLQALAQDPLVFEELIRRAIAPLRTTWTSTDITSFISSAAYFRSGFRVLRELAPHVLSTLLSETCNKLDDPYNFYDPWDNKDVDKFVHMLALFSLNFKCFMVFTVDIKENELDGDEDTNCPFNLYELLRSSVQPNSAYHYLGLVSLKTIIWNLNIYIYLSILLNFREKLLKCQELCILETSEDDEASLRYVIDNCSWLRHKILTESYYIFPKREDYLANPEECELFSQLPPPNIYGDPSISTLDKESELENFLHSSGPGLRDNSWVSQIKNAHSCSTDPMKISVLINLFDEMQQAIPTAEWTEQFMWSENVPHAVEDSYLPEEIYGLDLVLRYAEQNRIVENTELIKQNLIYFFHVVYGYIHYTKTNEFSGFDWFLSTVFLISEGSIDKGKIILTQLVQFPSTVYLWPILSKVNEKPAGDEFLAYCTLGQVLETVICIELPHIKYALKSICGVSWWTVCNAMLHQLFWGILPWNEILQFLAICIINPPDYIVYYCVSLLYHCRDNIMEDITSGKMWPENLNLYDYQCHNYMTFMDNLAKRYRNRALPYLQLRKEENSPTED